MSRILYIFPHPDDESFGPAPGIAQQLKQGHEVFLLTLTKGGATRVRHDLGLSVEEMGEVRLKEMIAVEQTLGLTGMTVLDLPDSGLKDMCPMDIEQVLRAHIEELKPDVIITYAVHGISGFFDHLVSHACVKRVFCEMKREGSPYPKRLAFFTMGPDSITEGHFTLKASPAEDIDCVIEVTDDEAKIGYDALMCYQTYLDTIAKTGVDKRVHDNIHFEFFGESFDPPLRDLTAQLPELVK
ncbi:PIG-L deacetylase family protein [Cyclonatronum proteinivorum]|nr:PIG-L family deacetylase [Cyclonatronum proteinivorum]